jgi:hypothetical protein
MVEVFKELIKEHAQITDVKKIDFVLWQGHGANKAVNTDASRCSVPVMAGVIRKENNVAAQS